MTAVEKCFKVTNNPFIAKEKFAAMFKEFEIGRKLRHPGIVETLFFVRQSKYLEALGGNKEKFYIIMELMEGGNLGEYLDTLPGGKMTELAKVKGFTRQIVETVAYLNGMKIVHQDLKPENILLNKACTTVKLCDFGISNYLDTTRVTHDVKGTVRYMSKELLDCKLTNKIDVWALGCILLVMITGKQPYDGINNEWAISSKIFSGVTPLDYALEFWKEDLFGSADGGPKDRNASTLFSQDPALREFIEVCLDRSYQTRPSAQ